MIQYIYFFTPPTWLMLGVIAILLTFCQALVLMFAGMAEAGGSFFMGLMRMSPPPPPTRMQKFWDGLKGSLAYLSLFLTAASGVLGIILAVIGFMR